MPKCTRCHRDLKNHTTTGMGKTCHMKASREKELNGRNATIRVEPLYVGHPARRAYLVFTSPRLTVVVEENEQGRFADCPCSVEMCEHRAAVAEFDRAKFPENIFPEPPRDNVLAFRSAQAKEKIITRPSKIFCITKIPATT